MALKGDVKVAIVSRKITRQNGTFNGSSRDQVDGFAQACTSIVGLAI